MLRFFDLMNQADRLTPVRDGEEYVFITLELDAKTFDIRRVVLRERIGNASEFILFDVVLNRKMNDKDFEFRAPRGVEIIRID